jgi:hypothetical protein
MLAAVDLNAYRTEAEAFASALDREYYLHFSGQRDEFEIEPIYERHERLFDQGAVDELRSAGVGPLLEFAVHGLIGRATRAEEAELARREAALEIELDGEAIPFRQSVVLQANEPDPERRAAVERLRLETIERELNPLHREMLERSHELTAELGWPSLRAMCEELSAIDLGALARATTDFLDATEPRYEPLVEPRLEDQLGFGFDRLRRSDLPAFFRAPSLDSLFPEEMLLPSFEETLAAMGLRLEWTPNVRIDTEPRPKKSPRAFCAPVRVPDEVYLVIPRMGGRDDFEALYHEAGHTEHYAHVDPDLPFEHRYLGDNSVTEGFAFLFQHLTASPAWLRTRLGVADPEPLLEFAHAERLVYLRRYAAKLAYELELHGGERPLDEMPARYSRGLSDALHVEWPAETWMSDVDPFFYAARYLRAWALEVQLRRELHERFGEEWFARHDAAALLKSLWREGQRLPAEELLAELTGRELDFSLLPDELAPA